eukprot:36716-Eustigmatos_ZCMA.PRE.1
MDPLDPYGVDDPLTSAPYPGTVKTMDLDEYSVHKRVADSPAAAANIFLRMMENMCEHLLGKELECHHRSTRC